MNFKIRTKDHAHFKNAHRFNDLAKGVEPLEVLLLVAESTRRLRDSFKRFGYV